MKEYFTCVYDSFRNVFNQKVKLKAVVMGLDSSGKTALLYREKVGSFTHPTPTLSFNIEKLEFGRTTIEVWDLGSCASQQQMRRHYLWNTHALIFVVSSTDAHRLEEARGALFEILESDQLNAANLMVLVSKIDQEGGLSLEEVRERLTL
jgi:small GTP-binding protein